MRFATAISMLVALLGASSTVVQGRRIARPASSARGSKSVEEQQQRQEQQPQQHMTQLQRLSQVGRSPSWRPLLLTLTLPYVVGVCLVRSVVDERVFIYSCDVHIYTYHTCTE